MTSAVFGLTTDKKHGTGTLTVTVTPDVSEHCYEVLKETFRSSALLGDRDLLADGMVKFTLHLTPEQTVGLEDRIKSHALSRIANSVGFNNN